MRDKRAIIIKDSRLQKIRNGFRDIFYQSASLKRRRLHDKWRNYLFNPDGSRRSIETFSPSELKQFRLLQQEENRLTDMINRSILNCVACGKGDRDMVYNKAYDAWYCTSCYGMNRDYAKKLHEKRAKTGSKAEGHEEEAIESHSKTFL